MPVASILSRDHRLLTTVVGDYGLYAVFRLMLVDAVLPAASELVMVYGGAVAAGAFAGQDVRLFGCDVRSTASRPTSAIALAGTIGYPLGSLVRLGDRRLRRPAVSRAARPLAPPERGEARPRRALVRALGGLGRLPRPRHAGRSLVRLDPGRGLPGAVRRYIVLTLRRLGDLVLRLRGRRLGGRRELGGLPPRVPLRRLRDRRPRSWQVRPSWRGSCSRRARGESPS